MAYAKINSITNANMAKVSSVAKAALGKITSIDAPSSFVNTYSIDFDGANDRLLMGNVAFDVGSYSIWIKTTETAGTIILQKDAGWYFYNNSGQIKVQHPMITGTLNGSGTINDGGWHHLLVTCAGGSGVTSEVKLYIDGSLDITKTNEEGNEYDTTTDALSVGYSDIWGGYYTEAQIDEVSFWTSVLTASEVTALYNSGRPINLASDSGDYASSSNLQHWWRMGDGDTYPTIEDNAGSLDGTMVNMASDDIETDVPS
jgi:hypothetical protein